MLNCDITLDELKPALRLHRIRNGVELGCQLPATIQHRGRNLCVHHYRRELRREGVDAST